MGALWAVAIALLVLWVLVKLVFGIIVVFGLSDAITDLIANSVGALLAALLAAWVLRYEGDFIHPSA